MYSLWSVPISLLVSALTYIGVIFPFTNQEEVWALTLMFILPFTHIVLLGLIGLGGIYIPKENKALNIIGYAICISAIISPVIFLIFPELTKVNTFINIRLTY